MPLGSILGTFGNVLSASITNQANLQAVRETNAANIEMVKMQNEAAAQESLKAYERSKAGNQVQLMRSAGMSRAGAINQLNGGGSYTPAPVNVAQQQAPQYQAPDLSPLANIDIDKMLYTMRDRKELDSIYEAINKNVDEFGYQPTLADVYQVLNKKQQRALTNPYIREQVNNYINESLAQSESSAKQKLFMYEFHNAEYNRELRELDIAIRKAVQDDKLTAEKAEYIARSATAKLTALQDEVSRESFEKMDKETLQKYAETRAVLEWLSHIGEMTAEKAINKLRTIVGL